MANIGMLHGDMYLRHAWRIILQNDINLYVYLNAVPSMELPDKSFPDCICKNFTQNQNEPNRLKILRFCPKPNRIEPCPPLHKPIIRLKI